MVSINISIKREAYNFLKSLKTKDKSFSDIILELKENKGEKRSAKSLLRFAGALKDIDWEERGRRMKDFRKSFNERLLKVDIK
ncbi:antitoxin VapB family protein [Candidatus Woesearchaeota archaeon]|nr:antitoxin VapB family protein [Candidatus Woesearchaeota archaeon]